MQGKTLITLSSLIATLFTAPTFVSAGQNVDCPSANTVVQAIKDDVKKNKTANNRNKQITLNKKYTLTYNKDKDVESGQIDTRQSNSSQCVYYLGGKIIKGTASIAGKATVTPKK